MRDPERIHSFCEVLACIWKTYVPDWRFGQLMHNAIGSIIANGKDPFFLEDKETIEQIRQYLSTMKDRR